MKKKKIYLICVIAIMIALCFALDRVATFEIANSLKITFYALPLLVTGIIHGPIVGLITGAISGLFIQLFKWGPSVTTVFYMIAPAMWGLISGLVYKGFKNKSLKLRILGYILAVVSASIMATISNTFAFFMDFLLIENSYYTPALIIGSLLGRIITMLIMIVIYSILVIPICTSVNQFVRKDEVE